LKTGRNTLNKKAVSRKKPTLAKKTVDVLSKKGIVVPVLRDPVTQKPSVSYSLLATSAILVVVGMLSDKIKASLNYQNRASAQRRFDYLVNMHVQENQVSRVQLIGGLQMYIEDQDPRTPQQRTIGFRPNNDIKTLTASGVVIADGRQTRQVIREQNQQLNDEIKELKEQLRLSKLEQERIRSNMTDTMKLELEKAENQRLQIAQERDIEIQKAKDMIKEQQERLAQEEKALIKKQSDKLIEQTKQESKKVIKKIKQSKSQLEKELEELRYESEKEQKELKRQYDEMTDKSSKDAQDLLKKLNDAEVVRAEIQATLTQAQRERDLYSQKNEQLSKQLLDTTNLNAKQIKELERKNAEKQRQLTLQAEKRIKQQQLDIEQRNRKQLESITKLINKYPKQRNTILKIENQVRQNKNKLKSESKSKLLSKENVNAIVSTIPQEYRGSLGTTVRSLLNGDNLDMNSAVSGLLGLSLTFGTGMPLAGSLGSMAFNYVRDRLDIDMNNIFAEDREIQENEQKAKQEIEQLTKSKQEQESIATQERIKSSELNKQLTQTRQKTQQEIKQLQLKQQTEIKQREAKLKDDLKKQSDKFTEQEKKLKQQHKTKLSEIDKQIKQIQNDRKKTEKSKEIQIAKLTQQKDKLEVDYKQSQENIKVITKQNKKYVEELKKLKKDNDKKIKDLEEDIRNSDIMNNIANKELSTLRTESKKEIEKLNEKIQLLEQEKIDIQALGQSSNTEQTKRYTQRLNELQKEKQSLQRELKQSLEVKQEIDNEIDKLKTDVSTKANELKSALEDRTQIQSELDNINIQFQQAQTNRTNLQSQLQQAQTNRTNLQSQLQQAQTNRTNLQSQLEQVQTNRTNLQTKLQKKDDLINRYRSDRQGLIDRITNQESKINEQLAREELIIKKVNNQTDEANRMITQLDKNKTVLMDKNKRLDLSLDNSIKENNDLRQNNTRLELELKRARDKLEKQLQEQKRLEMLSMIEPDNSRNQDNNLYTNNIDMSESKHGKDKKINEVQLEEDVIIDEVKESMYQYITRRVRQTGSIVRNFVDATVRALPSGSIIAISENIRSGLGNPFQGLIPFRSSDEILNAVSPEERKAYESMNQTLTHSDDEASILELEDEKEAIPLEDGAEPENYMSQIANEFKSSDNQSIRGRLNNIRFRMKQRLGNIGSTVSNSGAVNALSQDVKDFKETVSNVASSIPNINVERTINRVADRISQLTGLARNMPNVLGYATDFVMRGIGNNIDFTSDIDFGVEPRVLRQRVSGWNGLLSRQGMSEGAIAGGLAGAQSGYSSTGSATGGIAGIIPGLLSGAIVGAGARSALERLLPNASPTTISMLSNIPPTLLGAYLGFSPTGDIKDISGKGVLSGAGLTNITEEKIDANILKEQIDTDHQQTEKGTGLFRPKFIIPSKEIFSQTQQQKYNDDVLFSLFDMVTEEGGLGGNSNPLVRSNNMNDDIRYKGAGITLDNRLLFNKDITQKTGNKELDKMFLGNKLPPVKFVYQDPEDSFKYEANQFFVNNENTAIQMLSPYDDMTRTDQFWQTFPKSMLYSQVP